MGKSLPLSYSQMGLLGTMHFVGHMLSDLLAGRINETFGARKTISAGLVIVWSIPTIMSAPVGDYMGPDKAV